MLEPEPSPFANSNHPFIKLQEAEIEYIDAGYRKFKIVFVKGLKEDAIVCNGSTDFEICTLFLEPHQTVDQAVDTLLHEVGHIVAKVVGLDNPITGEEGKDDAPMTLTNEYLVTQMTVGWALIHNLNPGLMEILFPPEYDETTIETASDDYSEPVKEPNEQ